MCPSILFQASAYLTSRVLLAGAIEVVGALLLVPVARASMLAEAEGSVTADWAAESIVVKILAGPLMVLLWRGLVGGDTAVRLAFCGFDMVKCVVQGLSCD